MASRDDVVNDRRLRIPRMTLGVLELRARVSFAVSGVSSLSKRAAAGEKYGRRLELGCKIGRAVVYSNLKDMCRLSTLPMSVVPCLNDMGAGLLIWSDDEKGGVEFEFSESVQIKQRSSADRFIDVDVSASHGCRSSRR